MFLDYPLLSCASMLNQKNRFNNLYAEVSSPFIFGNLNNNNVLKDGTKISYMNANNTSSQSSPSSGGNSICIA